MASFRHKRGDTNLVKKEDKEKVGRGGEAAAWSLVPALPLGGRGAALGPGTDPSVTQLPDQNSPYGFNVSF